MKEIKTDIVILGAGIGGYETFRCLNKQFKKAGISKKILLVDQNNYFTFTPLLHEVATGAVELQQATISIRELLCKTNHTFLRAKISQILPEQKRIKTDKATITYDYCVVALGSKVNHFNTPGSKQHSFSVRTAHDAILLKNKIIDKLEDETSSTLSINIVGGGYTGVEVAAQIAHLAKKECKSFYKEKKIQITVIESGKYITKQLPKKAQEIIIKKLKQDNIKILCETRVTDVAIDTITLHTNKKIPSNITIWAAGFKNIADTFLPLDWTKDSRIPVTPYLTHEKSDHFYAVGDIVLFEDSKTGIIAPQLGEAAHKEGQYVAKHITKSIQGTSINQFSFTSHGSLIPIGNWYAVAIIGNFVFAGRLAWWLRRTAYLLFLPGIVRKFQIVSNWTLRTFGFRPIIDTNN